MRVLRSPASLPALTVAAPAPHLPPQPTPPCSQIKGTVLLMPSGSDRITSAPLQPLQSDKSCDDEEVKGLLSQRCAERSLGGAGAALSALVGGMQGRGGGQRAADPRAASLPRNPAFNPARPCPCPCPWCSLKNKKKKKKGGKEGTPMEA